MILLIYNTHGECFLALLGTATRVTMRCEIAEEAVFSTPHSCLTTLCLHRCSPYRDALAPYSLTNFIIIYSYIKPYTVDIKPYTVVLPNRLPQRTPSAPPGFANGATLMQRRGSSPASHLDNMLR